MFFCTFCVIFTKKLIFFILTVPFIEVLSCLLLQNLPYFLVLEGQRLLQKKKSFFNSMNKILTNLDNTFIPLKAISTYIGTCIE